MAHTAVSSESGYQSFTPKGISQNSVPVGGLDRALRLAWDAAERSTRSGQLNDAPYRQASAPMLNHGFHGYHRPSEDLSVLMAPCSLQRKSVASGRRTDAQRRRPIGLCAESEEPAVTRRERTVNKPEKPSEDSAPSGGKVKTKKILLSLFILYAVS